MTKAPKNASKNTQVEEAPKAPSVIETIRAAEAADQQQAGTEGTTEQTSAEEPAQPFLWGDFKVEVGVTPPSKSRAGVGVKYHWDQFPAPADPKDEKTWPSVVIPGVNPKTISGSIKKFRERLQKEGKTAIPEFTLSVVKDANKKATGVRVFRKS